MTVLIQAFGLLLGAIGIYGAASPDASVRLLRSGSARGRYALAIGLRLVLGGALWMAAPEARLPTLARVLSAIALVAAAGVAAVGPERLDGWLRWWLGRPSAALRLGFGVAAGLGGLLVYLVAPV